MSNLEVKLVKATDIDILDTLSKWMYDWWGKSSNYSLEQMQTYMHSCTKEDKIPQTYGLFLDGNIIGMYQFIMTDIYIRPDIYPWLACVFIHNEYRNKGYAKILLNTVTANAEKAGLEELYLFTYHIGLYEKFGFEYISDIDTFKEETRIQRLYKKTL